MEGAICINLSSRLLRTVIVYSSLWKKDSDIWK